MHKIIKFLISGVSSTLSELSAFYILWSLLSFNVVAAHIASFAIGLTVSFSLNRIWVFRSKGYVPAELTKYVFLALLNLVLSTIFIDILVGMLNINGLVAKTVVIAAVATWNYFIFSKYIFRLKTLSN